MRTIICGAGDVGYSIADKLSKENFEVTVIDESSQRLSKVSENLDVKTIKGIPSLPSVLLEAGADDCQILIASLGITNFTQVENLKSRLNLQSFEVLGWLSL